MGDGIATGFVNLVGGRIIRYGPMFVCSPPAEVEKHRGDENSNDYDATNDGSGDGTTGYLVRVS